MATETVPATDIEDCLVLGKAFSALAQWIEQARQIVDHVDSSRRNWPDLDRALREHDICTGLDWNDEASSGLVYLMQEVEHRFSALHEVRFPRSQEAAA